MLAKALYLCCKYHLNQTTKDGKPYALHPLKLMQKLQYTEDEELLSIAVMHDLLEDCEEITEEFLYKEGFSTRVVEALKLLTHKKGESYQVYIHAMKDNIDAMLVKREDLRHNSDITRLKGIEEADQKRIIKYHKAFSVLQQQIKDYKAKYREVLCSAT